MGSATQVSNNKGVITLGTKKMSGDFSAQLQVLYSFNDGIFCKKSKVYSISDLAKKRIFKIGSK